MAINNASSGVVDVALAHGLTIAVMIGAVGHISGAHFNPAVTIAMLATKKMKWSEGIGYLIGQFLGGFAGGGLALYFFGQPAVAAGTPALGAGVDPLKAILIEAVLTFFLVFVIFGVAVDKRGPTLIASLLIGLTVTLDIMAGGPLTGAAMNPARYLGPAVVGGAVVAPWVYFLGPILGGLLGGIVYQGAFAEHPERDQVQAA